MIPEISIGEFLLFTMIALVVIRPDDWPKVLRKVGYYYGRFHDFMLEARQYSRKAYYDIVCEDEASASCESDLTQDKQGTVDDTPAEKPENSDASQKGCC